MTPLERVSQRLAAFTILGVPASATKEDIRKAYKKLVFQKHPDRNPDGESDFRRISAAYRFVTENADALGIKSVPTAEPKVTPRRVVSRPQSQSVRTKFDDEANAAAEIKSAPTVETKVAPRRVVSRPQSQSVQTQFDGETMAECESLLFAEGGPGMLHTAVSVYQTGRKLTYFVPTALRPGRNEVAVPTGMLVDSRHVMPKIIAFDSSEALGGLYEVDDIQCRAHFPGARVIQVRFAQA